MVAKSGEFEAAAPTPLSPATRRADLAQARHRILDSGRLVVVVARLVDQPAVCEHPAHATRHLVHDVLQILL
jgi:hypothetical protein